MAGHWGYGQFEQTRSLLQLLERFPLVGSLAARPGWFAIILGQSVGSSFEPGGGSDSDGPSHAAAGDGKHTASPRPQAPNSSGGGSNGREASNVAGAIDPVADEAGDGRHDASNEQPKGARRPITAHDVLDGFVRHIDAGDTEVWETVAEDMMTQRTTVGGGASVPTDRRSSGLLQWLSEDQFRFIHRAVQAHFASIALARTPDQVLALVEHAEDPWWEPVLILAASRLDAPRPLIESLLGEGHANVAALALAEFHHPPEDLRRASLIELLGRLGRGDRDMDQADAIAMAALMGGEAVRRTGVIAPVLATLNARSADVRRAAAEALGRLENPAAIPPLLTAIGGQAAFAFIELLCVSGRCQKGLQQRSLTVLVQVTLGPTDGL